MKDLFGNPIKVEAPQVEHTPTMLEEFGPGPLGRTCINCKKLISYGPQPDRMGHDKYATVEFFQCFDRNEGTQAPECQACGRFELRENQE